MRLFEQVVSPLMSDRALPAQNLLAVAAAVLAARMLAALAIEIEISKVAVD